MTNTIISLLSALVIAVGGLLAAFLLGKRTEERDQSKKQAKDYEDQAKKWANSGAESTVDRLRRIAKKYRGS